MRPAFFFIIAVDCCLQSKHVGSYTCTYLRLTRLLMLGVGQVSRQEEATMQSRANSIFEICHCSIHQSPTFGANLQCGRCNGRFSCSAASDLVGTSGQHMRSLDSTGCLSSITSRQLSLWINYLCGHTVRPLSVYDAMSRRSSVPTVFHNSLC